MQKTIDFRIVVITDTFFEVNGIGSYYRTLLDWCRRTRGGNYTIVCPRRDDLAQGDVADDVIPIDPAIPVPNWLYKDLPLGIYSTSAVCKVLKSIPGPKVIHVATSGMLGAAGARAARRLRLPLVGFFHTDLRILRIYGRRLFSTFGEWAGSRVAYWADRLAYNRCQAVLAPSPTARDSVRKFYSGPVSMLPYPLNVDRFRPASTRTGGFRDRYGRDGTVLVAAIGRVAQEKNLDLICKYLDSDPRISLVIVGDGPYSDALRKRWNVRITGFLSGQDLVDAYQQADIFVQLSLIETFGFCVAEALACGLPSVVLRSTGLSATLPPESGVELLHESEIPELADRCVGFARDPKRHQEAAVRAREFALRYSPDVLIPQFIDFHRSFLGG
ncbi:MAG: glycosyltransferase [Planctomycetota bacterium]